MDPRWSMEGSREDNPNKTLRELTLKWFTETAAPFILQDGNYPAWFQGFITRKEAEGQLHDKLIGCFLIRLSDKTNRYILSYRGRDRCRHFVINQNRTGQFIVSGDTVAHKNLTNLIEYYKVAPIEPFGEYLTSACFESCDDDLYDEVQLYLQQEPAIWVATERTPWQQPETATPDRPPALPPKGNRELTSSTSLMTFPSQAAPPVPSRSSSPKNLSSCSWEGENSPNSQVVYAELDQKQTRKRTPLTSKGSLNMVNVDSKWGSRSHHGEGSSPLSITHSSPFYSSDSTSGTVYSKLNLGECRRKSLPLLEEKAEERRSYVLNTPSKATQSKVESSWGIKVDKWRRFFPEHWRK